MLAVYRQHVAERAALGIPPLPLTAQQTAEVIELLKNPPAGEEAFLRRPDHQSRAGRRRRRRQGQGLVPGRGRLRHREERADHPRARHRTARHHAGRLQHPSAGRAARRRSRRRHRRRGAEEDAADVRRLPRRAGEGRGRQRQRQGRAAELGRRRVVHQPSGSAAEPDHHRVQGDRRNQHRRPVAGARTPPRARTSRCTRWRC